MKKTYFVKAMTSESYNKFMCGSHEYQVETVKVEAVDPAEAVALVRAMRPGYVVNEHPETLEDRELKAKEAARKAQEFADAEKAKAEKKLQKEAAKAAAMGMTVDEYRTHKKAEQKKRRYEREVQDIQEQINELNRRLAWYKARLEKM